MEAEVPGITVVEVIIAAIVDDFDALVVRQVALNFSALAAWAVAANELASEVAYSVVFLIHCVH